MTAPTVTVLAGGVGAARLLAGLVQVVDPGAVAAVVNVADDLELHGLRISPDLDTITYTLAGEINPETGWGLVGETWQAMSTVQRYGGVDWFSLGDRDLGTHMYRTHRHSQGAPLSTITAEITTAWGLDTRLLPVSDDPVRTMLTLAEGPEAGQEISFQEYFVQRRHDVTVDAVRIEGAAEARPAPGVIDPVLAIPGVREAVESRRDATVAVSPIIAGAALKGPADRLLRELGHEATVLGVARLYAPLAATLIIDEADTALADLVGDEGIRPIVARTVMAEPGVAVSLAETVMDP